MTLLRELQYRDDRTTHGPVVAVNRTLFCGDAAADCPVKPEVLEAPGVVIAVYHCCQPLETRHAAVRGLGVEQDRAGIVLDQLLLDLPDDLFPLLNI